MKKLLLLPCIIVLTCCNVKKENEHDKVATSIRSYFGQALNSQQQIDSFCIVTIDSLTGQELWKLSMDNFEHRIARSNMMAAYAGSEKPLEAPDADEEKLYTEISQELQHKRDSCHATKHSGTAHAGYFVKTFHTETENGKTQWSGEVQFLVDTGMKVWEYVPAE